MVSCFLLACEICGNIDQLCAEAANGFVTMDISKSVVNVEYYLRDMSFDGGDLYSVHFDLNPSYAFQITTHST